MEPVTGRQSGSPDRKGLSGPVGRVTFHNPENGFLVRKAKSPVTPGLFGSGR